MKKHIITYIACALLWASGAQAQVDRSKAPEPGPAPTLNIGTPYTFTLKNGLKVFVVENHKLPVVSFRMVLDNPPYVEGDKAGVSELTSQLMNAGSKARSKEQLDEEIDLMGATFSANLDGFYASSLKRHTNKLMEVASEAIFNPSFPQAEFDKSMKQYLSGIESQENTQDAIAGRVAKALRYGKQHAYGELETKETVKNVKLEDCKQFYDTYFRPNNGYLAIVGDITPKEAKKLVEKHFAKWSKGNVPTQTPAAVPAPDKRYVAFVDLPSSTQSSINITYPLQLPVGHPDQMAVNLMNDILGGGMSGRLFINLREKHGYTYGAYSRISADPYVGSFSASAKVRNAVTDSAVVEFMNELEGIRKAPVTQEELDMVKATALGNFARSLEDPGNIASFAINIARYKLPADYYATYLKRLQAISVADIQAAAQKYVTPENAIVMVVGKGSEVADKLKAFGPVQYFDGYANPSKPGKIAIPQGMNAQKVIDKYLEARGGKANIKALKNSTAHMSAEIMPGRKLDIKNVVANGKSYTESGMGGMVMSKQVYDGQKLWMEMQGQKQEMPAEKAKDAAVTSYVVPETAYESLGCQVTLSGVEKVGDKPAYALEVTTPSGEKMTEYFDMESGLKVRTAKSVKTPQGEMTITVEYEDYRPVAGVLFPHSIAMPLMGPTPTKMEVRWEANTADAEKVF